jgi:hypothetical protein
VEALAGGRFQKRLARLLVVPSTVAWTSLHRRQDVNKSGLVTTFREHLFDPCFFAVCALAHEFDLDAGLLGEVLRVLANEIAQRFGKAWVVEHTNVVCHQVRGHPGRVAEPRKGPLYNNAIPAAEHPGNLVLVATDQRVHHPTMHPGNETNKTGEQPCVTSTN